MRRKLNWDKYDGKWRPTFAWWPVTTVDGYRVWLGWVWTRWDTSAGYIDATLCDWEYAYRCPPTGGDGVSVAEMRGRLRLGDGGDRR